MLVEIKTVPSSYDWNVDGVHLLDPTPEELQTAKLECAALKIECIWVHLSNVVDMREYKQRKFAEKQKQNWG